MPRKLGEVPEKVTSLGMHRKIKYVDIAEQLKGDSKKRWITLFGEEKTR